MKPAFASSVEAADPLGAPEADLSAYYDSPSDPQIEHDFDEVKLRVGNFVDTYKGKLAELSPLEFTEMYLELDDIGALSAKIMTYASLLAAKDVKKYTPFESGLSERLTPVYQPLSFFSIEFNALTDEHIEKLMADSPELERYRSDIETTRKYKPHQLTLPEEELLSALSPAGNSQWISLYDKLEAADTFEFTNPKTGKTETLTQHDILNHVSGPDRDISAAAYACFSDGLRKNLMVRAHIMNAIVLRKRIMDEQRSYDNPISARNLNNNVEDDVVDALVTAVTDAYPRVSHRYYDIKRQELGLERLMPYDRLSPISEGVEHTPVPFEDAKTMILDSYGSFSTTMAEIAQSYFDNGWIDAAPTKGKDQGAFNHPGSVLAHPVVYMNYTGKPRDIGTLAHELGHACHSSLSAEHQQSQSLSDYPLTIAETASVFGEKLVFERQLAAETDPTKRKDMLAQKMEEVLSTVVRQIAFFNYEKEVHERRKEGELSVEDFNEIFSRTQQDSLGPAFDLDADYGMQWSYIGHMIHTPFYVYSYAFGDCLVNALYQKYVEAEDKEEFEERFLDILKAGGTKHHSELLEPLGIDLTDPAFWENAMTVIEKDLDRLEEAIAAEKALKAAPEQDNSPEA